MTEKILAVIKYVIKLIVLIKLIVKNYSHMWRENDRKVLSTYGNMFAERDVTTTL